MYDRLTAAQRGYTYRWQKAREGYLAKHPVCVMCQQRGYVVAATVVDHKIPPRLGEARQAGVAAAIQAAFKLFWDSSNWQSLCTNCHSSVKQAQEKSGLAGGCDASGVPLDANHHWHRR